MMVFFMQPHMKQALTLPLSSQIYSFGVLLWQMYTGSRPWSGLSHAQIVMQVSCGPQALRIHTASIGRCNLHVAQYTCGPCALTHPKCHSPSLLGRPGWRQTQVAQGHSRGVPLACRGLHGQVRGVSTPCDPCDDLFQQALMPPPPLMSLSYAQGGILPPVIRNHPV